MDYIMVAIHFAIAPHLTKLVILAKSSGDPRGIRTPDLCPEKATS